MLTVVTGPPAAGKTTYVRSNAKAGDIIIDLDALAVALGSPHSHNHPADIATVAQAARTAAIKAAVGTGSSTWLIHTAPDPVQLAAYRAQGANIVTVDPGPEVTQGRITAQRSPETQQVADRWYSSPGAQAGLAEARKRYG